MGANAPWFGVASYGLAALTYAAVAGMLLMGHPASRRAWWLTAAAAVSSGWAGVVALLLTAGQVSLAAVIGLDALHSLVWIGCVLSWLGDSGSRRPWPSRALYALTAGALSAWAWLAVVFFSPESLAARTVFPSLLGTAVIGFLIVEQVFRNARDDERSSLMLLSLASGGIFLLDLVVYAQATLLGELAPFIWQSRGVANMMLAPLLLLAAKRRHEWEQALFVSRQVTFYTASLVGVGSYLLAMGAIAYVIRSVGGDWGVLLQIAFLLLAVVVLLAVLFSASIRARFKVFLVKHFYRHKYDYRREWLLLTSDLGGSRDLKQLAFSALSSIARIVDSPNGALWLTRDGVRYERMGFVGSESMGLPEYDRQHPLLKFLAAKGWVVDSDEYRREPDRYGTAFGAPEENVLPPDSITVPLDCQGALQGFVILFRPPQTKSLNFEDHDILKTAGRQVAVVLAQAIAQEQLAETRQFEAVSKLTTFLMHDLKNLIAQQELVVANAQRFRQRPEFIDDTIMTVKSCVDRMRKVLDQLKSTVQSDVSVSRVDVSKVLMEVRSNCSDREPVPTARMPSAAVLVNLNREQMVSVLTHVVRNAQDATPRDGRIDIELALEGRDVLVSVSDTGRGMDHEFVRERLFRPFDSTKGTSGMGIGAYQVRHIVRAAGGDVQVESQPGAGTTFRIRLPAAVDWAARQPKPAA